MTDIWEYGEAAEREREEDRFPWPPREGEPVLATFGETWKAATFDPGSFFRRIPRDGGTGAAVIYYLAIGILVAGSTLFWESLSLYSGELARDGLAAELGLPTVNPVVGFLLSPAVLIFMLAISAAVTHMLLSLFDGGRHGFGTSIRVFAYAYSPAIFGVIPLVGGLVGTVWMVVLLILGLRDAHETDGWKTAVAVLLPFVLLMGVLVLGFLMILAAGAALMGAAG